MKLLAVYNNSFQHYSYQTDLYIHREVKDKEIKSFLLYRSRDKSYSATTRTKATQKKMRQILKLANHKSRSKQ